MSNERIVATGELSSRYSSVPDIRSVSQTPGDQVLENFRPFEPHIEDISTLIADSVLDLLKDCSPTTLLPRHVSSVRPSLATTPHNPGNSNKFGRKEATLTHWLNGADTQSFSVYNKWAEVEPIFTVLKAINPALTSDPLDSSLLFLRYYGQGSLFKAVEQKVASRFSDLDHARIANQMATSTRELQRKRLKNPHQDVRDVLETVVYTTRFHPGALITGWYEKEASVVIRSALTRGETEETDPVLSIKVSGRGEEPVFNANWDGRVKGMQVDLKNTCLSTAPYVAVLPVLGWKDLSMTTERRYPNGTHCDTTTDRKEMVWWNDRLDQFAL